jgi:hypothetical protein
MKVDLDLPHMKALLKRAIDVGTEGHWTVVAIQWMEAADKEITRLKEVIQDNESAEKSPG